LKGDLSAAKKLLEDCIVDYQTVEDKEGIALNLDSLGDISRLRGNLTIAETTYQQSKAIAQEINDNDAIAYAFTGLGDLYFDRADFPGSKNAYEQALTLRKQLGEKQLAAESQTALARLSIEEGHAADAEKMALESKQLFHQDHEADDELFASQVLIDALLAQGKVSEAQREVQAASAQAAQSRNIMFRLAFALSSARVLLAEEHSERARPSLEHIQKEAHAHELAYTELETRVALAQLARKMGHGAAAQAELSSLEASARVKGFGRVLRHATDEN
jgi:tetratricopeptide (TPR) repeat protein